jgi:hypothetical protein
MSELSVDVYQWLYYVEFSIESATDVAIAVILCLFLLRSKNAMLHRYVFSFLVFANLSSSHGSTDQTR